MKKETRSAIVAAAAIAMVLVCAGANTAYAALGVIKTEYYRTQQEIAGGRLFVDKETIVVYSPPEFGPDSTSYGESAVLLQGAMGVRSSSPNGVGVSVRVIKGDASVTLRIRGLAEISEGWGRDHVNVRPLEGVVTRTDTDGRYDAETVSAANRTYFRIYSSGQVSLYEYHWWDNSYSDFEKWCLAGGYSSQYDERVIEDRGYDDYGRYVVVRTYDPDIRAYYNITYYYTSNPWWWYQTDYGRFEYIYGYGWVFIPYPVFWHRHCYYHEAPPTGHYYHGIIIKEREEQFSPQIPKERAVPYRPEETSERNNPAKYKIRRTNPDNPPAGNGQNPTPDRGGSTVIPREPGIPEKQRVDEPQRKEPNGYSPRESREPQNDNPPEIREPQRKEPDGNTQAPPSGNGQIRPKEPQDGGNQSKPPEKPPEKEKKPVKKPPEKTPTDPPKKEKT